MPLMNFAYVFVLYQAILLAVPALIWLAGSSADGGDLIGGILAGGFQAAGMLTLSLAFQRGNVGLVAPILSLEGVFAAVFALIDGATLATLGAIGVVIATVGALALGLIHMTGRNGAAVAISLGAAACFGSVLWLVGRSSLDPVVVVWIFNATAAVVLRATLLIRGRRTVHIVERPALALAALLNSFGFVAFSIGAQDSLPVTAVIATQSAVASALAGLLFLDERLTKVELAGIAVLVIGVSFVAIGGT
jgi:drug/metabolite transporter (DMT)-like permease